MLTVRVARKETLADGVVGLTLSGDGLPSWDPGAHIDLHLPGGLVRQYSLCGPPGAWRIAVLREPDGRGGSAAVHDLVAVGDTLSASEPRNHFRLVDAERYLFLAGGIGITPILPMVASVARRGRPWHLAYGGRSMAFRDELSQWADHVSLYENRPLDLSEHSVTDGTAVYCCGPASLLTAVEERSAGWPTGTLHVERFTPVAVGHGESFEVELAGTGRVLTVPADRSVLATLRAAGLSVLSSCEEGTCGTCETGVLDGVPDHRDTVLTPAEREVGDIMMICVSRARTTRLVLDI